MHADIQEAQKKSLSNLIDEIQPGEELILEKNGKPVAKIVPFSEKSTKSSGRVGGIPGIKMKDNFDDPLPKEIAEAFGMTENE